MCKASYWWERRWIWQRHVSTVVLRIPLYYMCLSFIETLCECYRQGPVATWRRGAVSGRLRLPGTHALLPCNKGQDSSCPAGSASQQNHVNNHPGRFNSQRKYVLRDTLRSWLRIADISVAASSHSHSLAEWVGWIVRPAHTKHHQSSQLPHPDVATPWDPIAALATSNKIYCHGNKRRACLHSAGTLITLE